jgi:hypothetical protein
MDDYSGVLMPVWTPPTPPREGTNDTVTDPCLAFLYEAPTIPENHLPPTHCLKKNGMDLYAMKRNTKRTHYMGVFKKKRHRMPRAKSIFDKKALEILNKNKLKKSQKLKQKSLAIPPSASVVSTNPSVVSTTVTNAGTVVAAAAIAAAQRPITTTTAVAATGPIDTLQARSSATQGSDWMISEDWSLLQSISGLSELPLDFQSEAVNNKLANWELTSDVVNVASRIHRSSKQCKERFLIVILPREEGKLAAQLNADDGKMKKNKKNLLAATVPPVVPPKVPTGAIQQKTHLQFKEDHGKSPEVHHLSINHDWSNVLCLLHVCV